jgi:glutathionyl-hydroquinone reductase
VHTIAVEMHQRRFVVGFVAFAYFDVWPSHSYLSIYSDVIVSLIRIVGKYTVPILYDKVQKTIVSNESSEIIQMLNSCFNQWAKYPDTDLNPVDLRDAMAEVDSWVYPNLNNGVYRCGFATTQGAYDKAITDLTDAFDRAEELLSKQRFVAGDRFTLSDIRLFVTLLRFDEVYVVYFKTNTRSIANSPVLLNYCRDIYQHPGVKSTVNMDQIKMHYFCSHPDLNKYSIIPKGSGFEQLLQQPHNRYIVAKKIKYYDYVDDEEKKDVM